jgi:hypothetical protein
MTTTRLLALLSLPAAVLLMAGPAAAATPADAGNFGTHVSTCAQTMGFSGAHNPGMHRGVAGWDGMPC